MLGVPWNNFKNTQRIAIIIFGIEINTTYFIVCLQKEKLEKITRATTKVLGQKSICFIDIKLFVSIFSFCS